MNSLEFGKSIATSLEEKMTPYFYINYGQLGSKGHSSYCKDEQLYMYKALHIFYSRHVMSRR